MRSLVAAGTKGESSDPPTITGPSPSPTLATHSNGHVSYETTLAETLHLKGFPSNCGHCGCG